MTDRSILFHKMMKQLYTQQQQDEGKKNKNTDRRWARAERSERA
jgi:hypothetical protein